jgi:hypothetical protein
MLVPRSQMRHDHARKSQEGRLLPVESSRWAFRRLTGSFGQLTGQPTAWRVSNDAEVIYMAIGNGEKHLGTFPPREHRWDYVVCQARRDTTYVRDAVVYRSAAEEYRLLLSIKRQPGDQ